MTSTEEARALHLPAVDPPLCHVHTQQTTGNALAMAPRGNGHERRTSYRAAGAAGPTVLAHNDSRPCSTALATESRQEHTARHEPGTMEMLLAAALGDSESKKRGKALRSPASKRARTLTSKDTTVKPPRASRRSKKRRHVPVTDAATMEASPIITDLPPLPFTLAGKASPKAKKGKGKVHHSTLVPSLQGDEARPCEFCHLVANICVLMRCLACRRVYHAGCFVQAFKPFVDPKTPLVDQLETFHLHVPDRRGTMFRCASCKAAFLDFYGSGGYMWECDCPTCVHPETTRLFRQRKLIQMMNDLEVEKQRKRVKKEQDKREGATRKEKGPVVTSSRSHAKDRSRRSARSGATSDGGGADALVKVMTRGNCSLVASMQAQPTGNEYDTSAGTTLKVVNDVELGHESASFETKVLERNHVVKEAPETTNSVPFKAERIPAIACLEALALYKRGKLPLSWIGAEFEFVARVVCLSPKYVMSMANGSLVDLVVRSQTSAPGDSFPRKVGWLSFSRQAEKARVIACGCCDKTFRLNEFVEHAGIVLAESKKKPRQVVYVVERQDDSVLMPYTTFAQSLDTAHANHVLDPFLKKLPFWVV